MYKIYCDETWTSDSSECRRAYYVFYGVMIDDEHENSLLQQIVDFKKRRGLLIEDKEIELKWTRVEEEWKNSQKTGRRSRYEEYLDIFFDTLRTKILSFGYMFLEKTDYARIEADFAAQQPDNKHNFFFMLYFQFLYHCFIKNQVKQSPCQILIDNRDMGAEGAQYDVDKLRQILNRRAYRDIVPKYQLTLSSELERRISESIQFVNLAESKDEPLIQLSDLCAGCVRYTLETELPAPEAESQIALFPSEPRLIIKGVTSGRDELVSYFYRRLRAIDGYRDINLLRPSYHHRFNIFPLKFSQ